MIIEVLLSACAAICVNCAYVCAAFAAAQRYNFALSLRGATPTVLLIAGTFTECVIVVLQPDTALRIMSIIALGAVVAAAACDAASGYVYDALTLPCLIAMSLSSFAFHTLGALFAGAGVCGGALLVLYAITCGRGLGLGDVKLSCCIGGLAGAAAGIEALGIAFVLGGVHAAALLAAGRARRGDELRFAPYLAAGTAAVMLHGVFA